MPKKIKKKFKYIKINKNVIYIDWSIDHEISVSIWNDKKQKTMIWKEKK
jgi:hypothetical protein